MNVPATKQSDAAIFGNVLIRGDLKDLTEEQKNKHYLDVCNSLGLNPATRPFEYLMLNGKLQLYARRDAADQLRKINGISIEVVSREIADDMLTVHVRAKDKTGRTDEDFGVVPFKGGATEIAANSMMKAITKAKRRVTLSISGLGFMDESETDFMGDDKPDYPVDASKPVVKISKTQLETLIRRCDELAADKRAFVAHLAARWGVDLPGLADIPASEFDDAMAELQRKADAIDKADAQASANPQ